MRKIYKIINDLLHIIVIMLNRSLTWKFKPTQMLVRHHLVGG
jgi:hypothetical protein